MLPTFTTYSPGSDSFSTKSFVPQASILLDGKSGSRSSPALEREQSYPQSLTTTISTTVHPQSINTTENPSSVDSTEESFRAHSRDIISENLEAVQLEKDRSDRITKLASLFKKCKSTNQVDEYDLKRGDALMGPTANTHSTNPAAFAQAPAQIPHNYNTRRTRQNNNNPASLSSRPSNNRHYVPPSSYTWSLNGHQVKQFIPPSMAYAAKLANEEIPELGYRNLQKYEMIRNDESENNFGDNEIMKYKMGSKEKGEKNMIGKNILAGMFKFFGKPVEEEKPVRGTISVNTRHFTVIPSIIHADADTSYVFDTDAEEITHTDAFDALPFKKRARLYSKVFFKCTQGYIIMLLYTICLSFLAPPIFIIWYTINETQEEYDAWQKPRIFYKVFKDGTIFRPELSSKWFDLLYLIPVIGCAILLVVLLRYLVKKCLNQIKSKIFDLEEYHDQFNDCYYPMQVIEADPLSDMEREIGGYTCNNRTINAYTANCNVNSEPDYREFTNVDL